MSKRFTDTTKWRKDFFKKLPYDIKLFWLYIIDECDHAGIWNKEIEVASLRIGIEFKEEKIMQYLQNKIVIFDNSEKYWIPSFIDFQYGNLNPNNKVHASVLQILSKYGLKNQGAYKGHTRGLYAPKEKEKEKDKDKEKDKNKTLHANNDFIEFWEKYPRRNGRKVGKKVTYALWLKLSEFDKSLILKAVMNYANSKVAKEDYAKDPKRFIKNDYWRDWLEEAKKEEDPADKWFRKRQEARKAKEAIIDVN
jgi:hypothetical protein